MPVGYGIEKIKNGFIVRRRKKTFNTWDYTLKDILVIMGRKL
jgi:hypothetical protein